MEITIYILALLLALAMMCLFSIITKLINNNKPKMSHFSKDQEKAVEQLAKQFAQQVVQSVGQDKVIGYDSNKHDIDTDEAHKRGTHADTEMWSANKKSIFAVEHSRDQNARDFAAALNAITLADQLDASLVKSALRWDYAKFNNATSEPISPDTGSDDNDAEK